MATTLYRVPISLMLTGLYSVVVALAAPWLGVASHSTYWVGAAMLGAALVAVGLLTAFFISVGGLFMRGQTTVVVVERVRRRES